MKQKLFLLFGLITCSLLGAEKEESRAGFEPYVPTKIEWLALEVQADLRTDATEETRYALTILVRKANTITILVRYSPDVDREIMNAAIEMARSTIRQTARCGCGLRFLGPPHKNTGFRLPPTVKNSSKGRECYPVFESGPLPSFPEW